MEKETYTFVKHPITGTYTLLETETSKTPPLSTASATPISSSSSSSSSSTLPTIPSSATSFTPSSRLYNPTCTHLPLLSSSCPSCLHAYALARIKLINAFYDPVIADLEARIRKAEDLLWAEGDGELRNRVREKRGELERVRARKGGEVGEVWRGMRESL